MGSNIIAVIAALIAFLSAAAAWAAVFVQRRNTKDTINTQVDIGARKTRATVVSANRQKWIDALRTDISAFIATRSQFAQLANVGSFRQSGQDSLLAEERRLRKKLHMLRVRVELRTNRKEENHIELLKAIDQYDSEFTDEADRILREKASAIFKEEWERLKKEAS